MDNRYAKLLDESLSTEELQKNIHGEIMRRMPSIIMDIVNVCSKAEVTPFETIIVSTYLASHAAKHVGVGVFLEGFLSIFSEEIPESEMLEMKSTLTNFLRKNTAD